METAAHPKLPCVPAAAPVPRASQHSHVSVPWIGAFPGQGPSAHPGHGPGPATDEPSILERRDHREPDPAADPSLDFQLGLLLFRTSSSLRTGPKGPNQALPGVSQGEAAPAPAGGAQILLAEV